MVNNQFVTIKILLIYADTQEQDTQVLDTSQINYCVTSPR